MRITALGLALSLSACAAAAPPRIETPAAIAPRPSAVAAARSGCDGIEIELVVREPASSTRSAWSRRIALRCHDGGATLTYETDAGGDHEGSWESLELAPEEADALWSQLRDVSLATLACDGAHGARSHRVQIAAPRGVRIVECAVDETPAEWSALESLLDARPPVDETSPWPFDAENWQGELGYARSPT